MEDQDAKAALREALETLRGDGPDMGAMQDAVPLLTAFLSKFAAPDFVCVMVPIPPTPGVAYPGVDGLRRAWDDWGGTFASVRAEFEEILESNAHLVMLVKQIAVTRHGGVELTQPSAMVWSFEAGRVARLEFHLDRGAALRAGELDAAGPELPRV